MRFVGARPMVVTLPGIKRNTSRQEDPSRISK